MNFKEETLKVIGDRVIKEFRIRAIGYSISKTERLKEKDRSLLDSSELDDADLIFQGTGNTIPWDKMEEITRMVTDYNDGFGAECWIGWITFEDNTWIERRTYDGSEWWEECKFPTLEDSVNDISSDFSDPKFEIIK